MSRKEFILWLAFFFELVSVRTFAWQQTSSSHVLSDFIQLFMNDKSKQAKLPVDPRTIVNLENRVITPTKLTIGLKTNILGVVETDFKTEVEYTRDYSVSTLIFVEGENADIIRENNSGVFFFDPGSRKAVRVCAISASLTLSNAYSGKVFVATGGFEQSKIYKGLEEVRQTSEIVAIKPGDSPETHKKACEEFARKKYAQVMQTLKGLASSRIYWDELSQCNPSEKITKTSVCGKWHRTLLPGVTAWTTPVCERRTGQKNFFCAIRSVKGGACSYRDPETKSRLTSGMFEYPCAEGLECKVTQPGGWFAYAKAECRPKSVFSDSSQEVLSVQSTHR